MFDFSSFSLIQPLQWGVAIGASLVAAVFDIGWRRIPNWLTGTVLITGLMWTCSAKSAADLPDAVCGSLIMACPFILLFMFAGGGAGDAKLMGAIGAWLGVSAGVISVAVVLLAGAILAVAFALARKQMRQALNRVGWLCCEVLLRAAFKTKRQSLNACQMETVPYAVAILAGITATAVGGFAWR